MARRRTTGASGRVVPREAVAVTAAVEIVVDLLSFPFFMCGAVIVRAALFVLHFDDLVVTFDIHHVGDY